MVANKGGPQQKQLAQPSSQSSRMSRHNTMHSKASGTTKNGSKVSGASYFERELIYPEIKQIEIDEEMN